MRHRAPGSCARPGDSTLTDPAHTAIRDATPADFTEILRLNAESERFLSPLTLQRLALLHAQAAYHRVVAGPAGVAAFLLAFREGCDYDSPNYRWFNERFDRFLYVDRIVVAVARQGQGLGRLLYADLFAFARGSGAARVTCEFDIEPPNEGSRRFHASFGFTEVGTQRVGDGSKRVSLQAVDLDPLPAQQPQLSLQPFSESQLAELMTWFPDRTSCQTWGGPGFRHPFTAETFRDDARLDSLPSWAMITPDGTLAAFGQYYPRLGRCHLSRLAVAPALRGHGIGTSLVRELCRQGGAELGVGSYSLFVLPGNEPAERLYRRLGFSAVPYPEPEPQFEACTYMVAPEGVA
jgi:predicted GNAT superfamily acetyltransferase